MPEEAMDRIALDVSRPFALSNGCAAAFATLRLAEALIASFLDLEHSICVVTPHSIAAFRSTELAASFQRAHQRDRIDIFKIPTGG